MDIDKLKFAMSCSSNMNRSMEAPQLYANGLLNMLDWNRRINPAPQSSNTKIRSSMSSFALRRRVYDQISKDNPEEATIGAWFVCELCGKLEEYDDLDNEIDEILADFEAKNQKRNILHTICFY
ncbi:hypothetical protein KIN20_030501 [Parelaphostrongylus tenuis]|uniref:RNA polymerase II subunit A C-terminal domain phosphatase SSU72 n=2 Tax=Parelaphostrongylus tenuis TaxID=148309 RepID=A0AAD5R3V3_PARTN|nr:hypothetical protein KIN20_030501 [Parelaphostrongylus tenuis]